MTSVKTVLNFLKYFLNLKRTFAQITLQDMPLNCLLFLTIHFLNLQKYIFVRFKAKKYNILHVIVLLQ